MTTAPSNKMEALNDLVKRGYNICFLMDQLINDYMTDAWFLDFHKEVTKKYPDPRDTTGTYDEKPQVQERREPCRILRLTSRQP